MKAAVIYEHGGPGSIKIERAFPDPRPGPDDVILKVRATTLNYHDIFTRRGMPGIKVPMPCIMGVDFAGEIAETLLGEMWHGGLAEYCRVPTHHLVSLPADVSYEAAACLPVAYGTAVRMMHTIGQVQRGDKVLILGASGGVGTCCVQLAREVGAEVIACASSDGKLSRLKDLGATHLIDYTKQDFVKWVYETYGKPHRRKFAGGVDVVVNFTGGDTWVPSLKVLHRGGKVLTCGATAGFDPKEDLRFIWTFELKVLGSNGWMREDLDTLIALIQQGRLTPVIDRELPLEEVNEAFRLLEDREVFGKVVVRP